jgi:ankyrin repeat protein
VRASVTHVDSGGMTALHWAARRGLVELVEVLLNADAPIEGTDVRCSTAHTARFRVATPQLHFLVRCNWQHSKHSPLQMAVMGGQPRVVDRLLRADGDPHALAADGRQLIHIAALAPCADLVEMLVKRAKQQLGALSPHGWSPLFLAVGCAVPNESPAGEPISADPPSQIPACTLPHQTRSTPSPHQTHIAPCRWGLSVYPCHAA